MNVPDYVKRPIEQLNRCGFEAYLVGGCVRDGVMGMEPHDYDVTTNATPEEIKSCFSDYRVIPTGEKHGTITVVSEGNNVEITTYRVDGEYKDSRHPEKVEFTKNIVLDLARRDFTMNAIAFNEEFIDPFGGKNDIEKKLIRAVGEPDKRFGEDALRIMRALRFAATSGFEIEEDTKKSIHKNAKLLKNISAERLYSEFTKLIMGDWAERVLLEFSDVVGVFIPEIEKCFGFDQKTKYHIYDVYTHSIKAVGFAEKNLLVKLSLFFHDIGKPLCFTFDENGGHFKGHAEISAEIAKNVLERLKVDNDTKRMVLNLVYEHRQDFKADKRFVKRIMKRYSGEFFDLLVKVKRADIMAHSDIVKNELKVLDEIEEIKAEIDKNDECVCLKDLKINGNDIKELGVNDGKEVGRILDLLVEMVIDEEIENDKEKLLEEVKKHLA